ncbi:MAG: thiamine-phosphate kinase [Candidatus Lokiarchaeia archaeon]|nr:thiamine-phosphate kinase [Candidatus Lokiarchaeia archaeon]
MKNNLQLGNLGEKKLIEIIEDLVLKKTGKPLMKDDSFFFDLEDINLDGNLVFNSDMLVSTTDVPAKMSSYQIGRKSIIMNVSDLIVKGVKPRGLIISLGLPKVLEVLEFINLLNGIIDCSSTYDLNYLGGDINESKELIINPTVFGFKNPSKIIYRQGINVGDILVANNKFGLTGVGFDILLKKNGDLNEFSKYKRSLMSVLEPVISENEAFILAEKSLATASIDSSDGLYKSLEDLMISNPNIGFEIDFNSNLIDPESIEYSKKFNVSLEELVFNGGEEYIHIFTINPEDFKEAQKAVQSIGGHIFKIGKIISGEHISISKEGEKKEVISYGFEHFTKRD